MDIKELINSFKNDDYEIVQEYSRIDECCEVIRLNGLGSLIDMPTAYQNKNNEYIYFKIKSGLIPSYRAIEENGKFKLYELTYKAYCKYGF